jgi:hypothetical protein
MKKIIVIIAIVLVLSAIGSFAACYRSFDNANTKSIPEVLITGNIEPVKDCFGSTLDYSIGGMKLIEDGYCSTPNFAVSPPTADSCCINKVNQYFVPFYLKDYQPDKVYVIYKAEGECLWWHDTAYFIGCEN